MKFIKYLVPGIMLFFFARNIVLVETSHLDSWMGGGMRMFGKIDKMLYRVSGVNVKHNNKTYFVNLRNIKALEDVYIGSKILPSDERLNELLFDIKSHDWYYNPELDEVILKQEYQGDPEILKPIAKENIINIAVYKVNYNKEDKKVSIELINNSEKI
ncbi:hypothetical protein KO493_10690 [Tamlana agarivorans]|uniref:Uncharacterized protein n=1 Tax=Pseudotamlana agarivorans TaxID=481183 RepID=A0ACC5UA06_9FLAO|nr:hypothetical protein [Tamlana agarivorans]MBU2951163.1 hypothetical protein [Tamlana agarivorans]